MDSRCAALGFPSFEEYPVLVSPVCYEGRLLELAEGPSINQSLLQFEEKEPESPKTASKPGRWSYDSSSNGYNTRNRDSMLKAKETLRKKKRDKTKKLKKVLAFFRMKSRKTDLRTRLLRLHRRHLKDQSMDGVAKTRAKLLQEYLDNPPLCDQSKIPTQSTKQFRTYNAEYCRYFLGKPHRRPVFQSYLEFVTDLFQQPDLQQVLGLNCHCGPKHLKNCTSQCNALKKQLVSEAFLFF